MRFEIYYTTGTPAQTAEALDLLEYEIHYLSTHPYRTPPDTLVCNKKSTEIYLRCRKVEESMHRPDPLYPFGLVLDMLRTLEGLIRERGMQEVEWQIINHGRLMAICGIWLQAPTQFTAEQ